MEINKKDTLSIKKFSLDLKKYIRNGFSAMPVALILGCIINRYNGCFIFSNEIK